MKYRIHSIIEGEHFDLGVYPAANRARIAVAVASHTMAERGFSLDADIQWRTDHLTVRDPESGRLFGIVGRCVCEEIDRSDTSPTGTRRAICDLCRAPRTSGLPRRST